MCKNVCKLCDRLIISDAVTFADGVLTVDLPAGSYSDKCKYCIVIAQAIPVATTIAAPVVFTIGGGTETYPLVNRCCVPVTACGIRTRTKYSTVLATTATGATFKLLGSPCCSPDNRLRSVDGSAPAAT